MNQIAILSPGGVRQRFNDWMSKVPGSRELFLFTAVLIVLNAPLLAGCCWTSMTFEKAAVLQGEWWRLLTHPFVHVSWYHLLLDATAFLALYASLLEKRWVRRLTYAVAGAAGCLIFACTGLVKSANTLCGLSGIAHGLMVVSALEMITEPSSDSAIRRIGWFSFVLVIGKAAFEALTGRMFFHFLEFGLLGQPVAISHLGGIVGSVTAWFLIRAFSTNARADTSRDLPSR